MTPIHTRLAAAFCLAAAASPLAAHAQAADQWNFAAAVYGYFPTVGGSTVFPPSGGSQSTSVDIDTILDDLQFAFMGTFEARKGAWGAFTDFIYIDLEATKSGTRSIAIGGSIPANVDANATFGLKGWVWTLAGEWRAVDDADVKTDLLFGARQFYIQPKLDWTFAGNSGAIPLQDRAGSREATVNNWDAIIGVKGRVGFGDDNRWYAPYYLDIGTGASKFTWQAYAGVGYSFGSWDLLGAWKYIRYEFKSGDVVQDVDFNGPAVAAVFRW